MTPEDVRDYLVGFGLKANELECKFIVDVSFNAFFISSN